LFVRRGESELGFQADMMNRPSDAEMHFAELAYKQARCWPYRQGLIIHQALIVQLPRRRAFRRTAALGATLVICQPWPLRLEMALTAGSDGQNGPQLSTEAV
jgi:hypothetical protein